MSEGQTKTGEMSRWGVGPCIVLSSLAYAAATGIATYFWPGACLISVVPYPVFVVVGVVLLALGAPMLIVAGRAAMIAYNRDELATTGIFSIVRNPIYSAWIVFLIPGLAMFSRSWPVLLTPLVASLVFKVLVRQEDEYLEKRFGDTYLEYKSRVNELIPRLRTER